MKFHDFLSGCWVGKHLLGVALLDEEGELLESTLPFSDERTEAIAQPLFQGLQECTSSGRRGNEFIVHRGDRCFVCVELPKGAALFALHGYADVDRLLETVRYFVDTHMADDQVVEALGEPEEQRVSYLSFQEGSEASSFSREPAYP